ncbi:hypothetical protein [Mycobacterium sp. JS623]|nr:hypothetical protein [Mycobacterium sp. JS623]
MDTGVFAVGIVPVDEVLPELAAETLATVVEAEEVDEGTGATVW